VASRHWIVCGTVLGFGTSKLLASIVYQATAADPLVILAVALTMALLGFLSAAIHAWRVTLMNSAVLLRDG
jgi:hypothetical protein